LSGGHGIIRERTDRPEDLFVKTREAVKMSSKPVGMISSWFWRVVKDSHRKMGAAAKQRDPMKGRNEAQAKGRGIVADQL
jgi:hypothetical protein